MNQSIGHNNENPYKIVSAKMIHDFKTIEDDVLHKQGAL